MTFDTTQARRYGQRELRPDDSYHAQLVLEACDEIDRLRAILRQHGIPSDESVYTPETPRRTRPSNRS